MLVLDVPGLVLCGGRVLDEVAMAVRAELLLLLAPAAGVEDAAALEGAAGAELDCLAEPDAELEPAGEEDCVVAEPEVIVVLGMTLDAAALEDAVQGLSTPFLSAVTRT